MEIDIVNTKNDEILSAMIATGNIPDVMFLREPEEWIPFARQEVLAPITLEQIKNNAPRHFEAVNSCGESMWKTGMDNGKIWAIPQVEKSETIHAAILRKDWLDKLGLSDKVRTLDEYETVFREFTYGDPDGNGKDDTYGLTGMGAHQERQFDSIFGAFGVMPGQWKAKDGVVALDTVSDGARKALVLLNKWYKSGYIHPECVTDGVNTIRHKFISGTIGTTFDSVPLFLDIDGRGNENIKALKENNENAEVTFSYPPEGENGKKGSYLWGPRINFMGFGAQLSDKPEVMNKILEVLDSINYDEETAVRQKKGILGVHFAYTDETAGKKGGTKSLGIYSLAEEMSKAGTGGFFNLFAGLEWAAQEIVDEYTEPSVRKINEELELTSDVGVDVLYRPYLPSAHKYQETLDNYKSLSYSKFITGERPLEEWDSFVHEFMEMGGSVLTAEAQVMYNEFFGEKDR